jgi:peptidyl-tRNA hydrolase, PTH1 family
VSPEEDRSHPETAGARIVLGLGNPGRRYASTRHNVGFRAVERLAADLRVRLRTGIIGDAAEAAVAELGGRPLVIARPLTFMNNSGEAAGRLAARFGAEPRDFIVVYDDVALPLGTIRIRPSGRSAGQKGMESIIRALGTGDIPRVRMGILGERADEDLADYVLDPFLPAEREAAEEMIERASRAVLCILEEGVAPAMNLYNRRGDTPD